MKYKLVKQKDDFGCGIACVASLLGITYESSLNLFKNGKCRAKANGLYCRDICDALNKKGKKFIYRYVKNRLKCKIYKSGTIVFTKKSKKYPADHYLLRTKDGWMDPWINFISNGNIGNARAVIRKRLSNRAIYFIKEKLF